MVRYIKFESQELPRQKRGQGTAIMRLQIEGADIPRAVFDPPLHHPEFALSRPSQLGTVAGSLGAPDQDVGLRREGDKPSTIHLTLAKGVANFCEQGHTGLQQHGANNE